MLVWPRGRKPPPDCCFRMRDSQIVQPVDARTRKRREQGFVSEAVGYAVEHEILRRERLTLPFSVASTIQLLF